MIMPGVQKPHCRPWFSRKASCIGCRGPLASAKPSMVVILAPSHCKASSRAGLGRDAVDMHDAGAALRGVAAHMRAGQPEIFAQELHQQGARFDIAGDGFAVHRHGHRRHEHPPKFGAKSPLFASPTAGEGGQGSEFEPILARTRLGTTISLNPHRILGQGIPKAKMVQTAVMRRPITLRPPSAAKFLKKSSAIFLAAPLTRRWPSWASLPPICASTL